MINTGEAEEKQREARETQEKHRRSRGDVGEAKLRVTYVDHHFWLTL